MRLDKYLKVSRLIKRRTVSHDLGENGKIEVNGKIAKPGLKLKVGDVIKVTLGNNVLNVRVKALNEFCKKEVAGEMYEVLEEITNS